MPLRDHFRSPLDDLRHWEGLHATWPVMIVSMLRHKLLSGYFAVPRVHPRAELRYPGRCLNGPRVTIRLFLPAVAPSRARIGPILELVRLTGGTSRSSCTSGFLTFLTSRL